MKANTLQLTFIALLIATQVFAGNQHVDGKDQAFSSANGRLLATGVTEECSSPKVLRSMIKNSLKKAEKRLLEDAEIADCRESNGSGNSKNFTFKLSFGSFVCPETFSVSHNPDASKNKRFNATGLGEKLVSCSKALRQAGKTSLQSAAKHLPGSNGKEEDHMAVTCDRQAEVYSLIAYKALEEHLLFPKDLQILECESNINDESAYYRVDFQHGVQTCAVHLETSLIPYNTHTTDGAKEGFIRDVKDCISIADADDVSAERQRLRHCDDHEGYFRELVDFYRSKSADRTAALKFVECLENDSESEPSRVLKVKVNSTDCLFRMDSDTTKEGIFMIKDQVSQLERDIAACDHNIRMRKQAKKREKRQRYKANKKQKKIQKKELEDQKKSNSLKEAVEQLERDGFADDLNIDFTEDQEEDSDLDQESSAPLLLTRQNGFIDYDSSDHYRVSDIELEVATRIFQQLIVAGLLEGKVLYKQNVVSAKLKTSATPYYILVYSMNNSRCELRVTVPSAGRGPMVYHDKVTTPTSHLLPKPRPHFYVNTNCVDLYGTPFAFAQLQSTE